ncbi:hypothetical protein VIAG107301_05265 [Vibrio agarivorans]
MLVGLDNMFRPQCINTFKNEAIERKKAQRFLVEPSL